MQECTCIVLAAGKGKRMNVGRTLRQKVLERIRNKPMLGHVLDVVASAGIQRVIVVVGHQSDSVKKYLGRGWKSLSIKTVEQRELLGTADAVKQALPPLTNTAGDILILYGDTPLLTEKTLRRLIETHQTQQNACTLLTTLVNNPTGYGRIVRNGTGSISKVTEELDATLEEREIREINVGAYCFQAKALFESLPEVKPLNRKGEYYLTDTISILSKKERTIHSVLTEDRIEVLGINSPDDLQKARLAVTRSKSEAHLPAARSDRQRRS